MKEEFIPPVRKRRPVSEDEDDHVYENSNENNDKYANESQSKNEEEEATDSSSEYTKKNPNRSRRLRESEKLISSSTPESSKRKQEKIKMEDEDAALAAYFSDDERDRDREREHSRLRSGTRFKDHLDNPTSTTAIRSYNPYARNGLGAYSGPMRRSGRTAAVVSAARVAMYSSMLNPDSSLHVEEPHPVNKYNLRPNRPGVNEDIPAYYEFNSERNTAADTSNNNNERLFEEDDVDGHNNDNNNNNNNESTGEVSLAALDKIAGMDGYVKKLKEMIVFPLIYPHLFSKLNISLPRGVLFHGPPGTGKTLMARLLAAACSTSTRKVSFFMRNGSDCLSKWIGEAERNMRLLFKKAKECQPSIIFFDEIDGLAPERTGRQDQSHISLVSTLLALMDGLDDRGQVVVIGATNRIHSIDAALRRPGRFDREFFFGLPDEGARVKILKIHTKTWEPMIEETLAVDLAGRTAGYSGADMKALCVEAALRAVQRSFPEVYEETPLVDTENKNENETDQQQQQQQQKQRQQEQIESVSVTSGDFEHALLHMTPSNRRHVSQYDLVSLQKPQSFLYVQQANDLRRSIIEPILKRNILLDASGKITWQLLEPLVLKVKFDGKIHPESLVWRFICGIGDGLDGFLVYPVDLLGLLDNQGDGSGFETALWRGLNDARLKGGAFCVLFKSFDGLGGKGNKKIFVRVLKRFVRGLLPGEPVVIIYPSKEEVKKQKLQSTMSTDHSFIKQFDLEAPTDEQVTRYFDFVLKSIYRLFSSSSEEKSPSLSLRVNEEEFVKHFKLPRIEGRTVGKIERMRMEINDEASRDRKAFLVKHFENEIFVEDEGRIEEPVPVTVTGKVKVTIVDDTEESKSKSFEEESVTETEKANNFPCDSPVEVLCDNPVKVTYSLVDVPCDSLVDVPCDNPVDPDEESYSYLTSLELPEDILFK